MERMAYSIKLNSEEEMDQAVRLVMAAEEVGDHEEALRRLRGTGSMKFSLEDVAAEIRHRAGDIPLEWVSVVGGTDVSTFHLLMKAADIVERLADPGVPVGYLGPDEQIVKVGGPGGYFSMRVDKANVRPSVESLQEQVDILRAELMRRDGDLTEELGVHYGGFEVPVTTEMAGEPDLGTAHWWNNRLYPGTVILDPDGWRVDGKSLDDLITRAEFEWRRSLSTIDVTGTVALAKKAEPEPVIKPRTLIEIAKARAERDEARWNASSLQGRYDDLREELIELKRKAFRLTGDDDFLP